MKKIISTICILTGLVASLIFIDSVLTKEARKKQPEPAKQFAQVVTKDIKLLPGFQAELLYTVPKAVQGSWVSMTVDPKGRLIVSDQYGSLYRIILGTKTVATKVEKLKSTLGGAHGLLYTFDSLYVVGAQKGKQGLYRLRDTNGDDQFDQVTFMKRFAVGGEHNGHAVVRGPDDKLYIVCGNMTILPQGVKKSSPFKNWANDWLLPQLGPPSGHNANGKPPGGFILRTDKEGQQWEVICGGFRNTYDIAFNKHDELFAYDSDMEYDSGTPWYRPTRLNHVLSGAEFGWRRGAAKLPAYYADTLGSVIDIGFGSPTGVVFGYGAKFPAKYQQAIYLNDWTMGRIRAIHLTPQGSTYSAAAEDFVIGTPLPMTDSVIGKDGAMYFLVGGRRTQSKLFRITYIGKESTSAFQATANDRATKARALRKKLESFHHPVGEKAVDFAWKYLASPDRAMRYAARIAIEHQQVSLWQKRALNEKRPQAAVMALIALVRSGDKSVGPKVLQSLQKLTLADLPDAIATDTLRAYALAFSRLGGPDDKFKTKLRNQLESLPMVDDVNLNHELTRLLVYLGSKKVVSKSIVLMKKSRLQEDQMFYANLLRNMKLGWTIQDRKDYFNWLNRARFKLRGGKGFNAGGYYNYSGGRSFRPYNHVIRNEALKTLSKTEKANKALTAIINAKSPPPEDPKIVLQLQSQPVVWSVKDLEKSFSSVYTNRSFEVGKAAFAAVQCAKCHRHGSFDGNNLLGPDLTKAVSRYSPKDLLESIIEPSKVISDQHADRYIRTDDGFEYRGKIVRENDKFLEIKPDPLKPTVHRIAKDEIEKQGLSKISKMPDGLLNPLTKEQILDLMAYILSAGDKNHKAFRKK